MTPPVTTESSTTDADRQAWTQRVAEIAALLGQPVPPRVEFLAGPLGAGAHYDHGTDTVRVTDGWIQAQPDPQSLASSSLLAHELGHREDRATLARARRMFLGMYAVLMAVVIASVVLVYAASERSISEGGSASTGWILPLLALGGMGALVLFATTSWPREFYADDVAGRLFGFDGVAACLAVYAARSPRRRTWPSHSHPSHRMRLTRHRRRTTGRR